MTTVWVFTARAQNACVTAKKAEIWIRISGLGLAPWARCAASWSCHFVQVAMVEQSHLRSPNRAEKDSDCRENQLWASSCEGRVCWVFWASPLRFNPARAYSRYRSGGSAMRQSFRYTRTMTVIARPTCADAVGDHVIGV